MSIKISSRKAKARSLQQLVASKVSDLFGIKFENLNDECPVKSRSMGNKGRDVYITNKELKKQFNFSIECKNVEKFNLREAIKQSKSNTEKDENWLVFWKCKDFHSPVVIMDSEVFFDMQKKIIDGK